MERGPIGNKRIYTKPELGSLPSGYPPYTQLMLSNCVSTSVPGSSPVLHPLPSLLLGTLRFLVQEKEGEFASFPTLSTWVDTLS